MKRQTGWYSSHLVLTVGKLLHRFQLLLNAAYKRSVKLGKVIEFIDDYRIRKQTKKCHNKYFEFFPGGSLSVLVTDCVVVYFSDIKGKYLL